MFNFKNEAQSWHDSDLGIGQKTSQHSPKQWMDLFPWKVDCSQGEKLE